MQEIDKRKEASVIICIKGGSNDEDAVGKR